jgi:opacity protein-like surface antigen
MRKLLVVMMLLLLCGVYAVAQDAPKGEVFFGYSYLHIGIPGGTDNSVPTGFNADGTYYLFKSVGATADFQYHHKDFGGGDTASVFSFHGGPRFKARSGRLEPFAHALFGVTHVTFNSTGSPSVSDNAFSMKLGGGLDVAAMRHIAIRLAEANYYYTKFSAGHGFSGGAGNDHQNNFTFSAGVVIR